MFQCSRTLAAPFHALEAPILNMSSRKMSSSSSSSLVTYRYVNCISVPYNISRISLNTYPLLSSLLFYHYCHCLKFHLLGEVCGTKFHALSFSTSTIFKNFKWSLNIELINMMIDCNHDNGKINLKVRNDYC